MFDRTPCHRRSRGERDGRRSPGVDTERVQTPARVDFRGPRQPENPGTAAMTAPLAGGEISTSATSHNGD